MIKAPESLVKSRKLLEIELALAPQKEKSKILDQILMNDVPLRKAERKYLEILTKRIDSVLF